MGIIQLARRLGWGCASALGGGLLYLFLIGVFWVPAKRTLLLELQSRNEAVLRIAPDVGRGFFEADTAYRSLPPATNHDAASPLRVQVPFTAKKICLELTSPDPRATLHAVYALTRHGNRALNPAAPSGVRTSALILTVPALADELPAAGHAFAAVCGTGSAMALIVWAAAVRRRLRVWWRYLVQPRVLCSVRGLLVIALLFGSLVLALSVCADVYHLLIHSIDNPPYWPISIFEPARPTTWSALLALSAFAVAIVASRLLRSPRASMWALLPVGVLILVVTNALHGWSSGYVEPTAGKQMYLADARSVSGVLDFLRDFTAVQPELRTHSRTHPPGAVLTYYALFGLTDDAGLMSLALGIASFVVTSVLVFAIVRSRTDEAAALSATWLFMLTPAVQVYFISSLDALICAWFTATVFFFLCRGAYARHVGTIVGLIASMSLSFGAAFLCNRSAPSRGRA